MWLVYPQNTWTYLGSHIVRVMECLVALDSTALNYDSLATIDDGSCLYPVYGCTDPLANNYDSLATTMVHVLMMYLVVQILMN